MKVVYVDVLIITNFIASLSFLILTSKLTHTGVKEYRLVIAGFLGGLSSLLILADTSVPAQTAAVTAVKIAAILLQISVCFATLRPASILRLGLVYFIVNLLFAGVCAIIWNITGGRVVYVKNYSVYFDISLGWLIAATVIVYAAMELWELFRSAVFDKNISYKVTITLKDKDFTLNGISDTGNKLMDVYYGKPVAVFYSDEMYDYLSLDDEHSIIDNKLHILPFDTVGGKSIAFATKPVTIRISDGKNTKNAQVCAGIVRSGNNARKCIFNPVILY